MFPNAVNYGHMSSDRTEKGGKGHGDDLQCLSTYDVARRLSLHPKTVRRMVKEGRIRAFKNLRGRLVFKESDLRAYVDSLAPVKPKNKQEPT